MNKWWIFTPSLCSMSIYQIWVTIRFFLSPFSVCASTKLSFVNWTNRRQSMLKVGGESSYCDFLSCAHQWNPTCIPSHSRPCAFALAPPLCSSLILTARPQWVLLDSALPEDRIFVRFPFHSTGLATFILLIRLQKSISKVTCSVKIICEFKCCII